MARPSLAARRHGPLMIREVHAGCQSGAGTEPSDPTLAALAAFARSVAAARDRTLARLVADVAALAVRTEVFRDRHAGADAIEVLRAFGLAVAHEAIPLTVVTGRAALLEREPGDHPGSTRAARIRTAAERVADVVRLAGRLGRGEPGPRPAPGLGARLDIRRAAAEDPDADRERPAPAGRPVRAPGRYNYGMSTTPETHEFQAEVRQLLDLMVHSLYSHKDIFLRELISNASDALDKLRFEALTRPELTPATELEIRLEVDPAARTLSVHDNGIGMTRDEVIQNIGTIARSGTREFLAAVRAGAPAPAPELIGQFGVGFYSSFMVADRVTLLTRRAGETSAVRWESTGGGYTLEPAERDAPGTTVTLHLKPADEEDGLRDYTAEPVLRDIVKKYSDFVAYPIRLRGETLNSMKAIWTRGKDEVSEDEHREFYKHIAHDWNDPLEHVTVHVEGTLEARALLYIPSKAPFDLWREGAHRGVQLYVKRVFIMDDCRELLPPWLRFVRGVVASDDLSLNVSREILQKDRQIQAIRRHLVRRVLAALKDLRDQKPDRYRTFWTEFGAVLKEGLVAFDEGHERILELVLAPSTHAPAGPTSLGEYVSRMKEGQEAIYYMTGPSPAAVERSPHLEAFRERGYEVLFFTDPVDELWLRLPREFEGKKLVSAGTGDVAPGSEAERRQAEERRREGEETFKDLLAVLRAALQDDVKDVRLSARLTSSPACLVGEAHDLSPHIAELLRRTGQDVPKVKRILELNPQHPLLPKLQALVERDRNDPVLRQYAELLYGQAILAEGGQLPDPAAFGARVAELMLRAV